MLTTRPMMRSNKYNIIVNLQHGFLQEKSTNTVTSNFIKDIYNSMDNKEISIGQFLDLSKTFDPVGHNDLT